MILVTGGCGYIGSHTVLSLLVNGQDVIIVDNLDNSTIEVIRRLRYLAKIPESDDSRLVFFQLDIRKIDELRAILSPFRGKITCCIHFAAKKNVGESLKIPLTYYDINVSGTINLLRILEELEVHNFVFSSSCTVYGELPARLLPIKEEYPEDAETARIGNIFSMTNPYGKSKTIMETILKDQCSVQSNGEHFNVACLRYFNPIGAHQSCVIGEDPRNDALNLVPLITQVLVGKRNKLLVFGNDYPQSEDGTPIRDYIHIEDLADAHMAAVKALEQKNIHGFNVFNVGTGKGTSVMQVINTMERVSQLKVNYEIVGRRPGDVAAVWCSCDKVNQVLGWSAKRSFEEACSSAWHFQRLNPQGMESDCNLETLENEGQHIYL